MQLRAVLPLIALLLMLPLGSCRKDTSDSSMFDTLRSSENAIGVKLGMTPAQVHEQLGQPLGSVTRQGGSNVEEYYLTDKYQTRAEGAPELALTYLNSKLMKLDNSYTPLTEEDDFPPFFIEPLEGVKLGLRRSDFVTALGEQEEGPAGTYWRFMARDGSSITIRAKFTDMEVLGDALCSNLTVTYAEPVTVPRGEELDKKK